MRSVTTANGSSMQLLNKKYKTHVVTSLFINYLLKYTACTTNFSTRTPLKLQWNLDLTRSAKGLGNLFVISRVREIENLDLTNFIKTTKMFVISRLVNN